MHHLEQLQPEIWNALCEASEVQLRAASIVACKCALSKTGVDDACVVDAMKTILGGSRLTREQRGRLKCLLAELDDRYLSHQEEVDENQQDNEEWITLFAQARAVTTIFSATDQDAFKSAVESIYEAAATSDSNEELISLIHDHFADLLA